MKNREINISTIHYQLFYLSYRVKLFNSIKSQLNCDPYEEMGNKSRNTETRLKVFAFRDVYQGECKRLVGFVKLILL